FSSRRRHTRSKRDWSSDVCSSDLLPSAGAWPTEVPDPDAGSPRPQSSLGIHKLPDSVVASLPDVPTGRLLLFAGGFSNDLSGVRSEERRVGKGSRWGWWAQLDRV